MKNFIVNIFKTLFFFDLAVIVFSMLPNITKSNPALTKLISEALILAVTVILTFIFTFAVERKKLNLPLGKHKIKLFFTGLASGAFIPVLYIALMAVLKNFHYIGIYKTSYSYYWILALLCNALAAELLLRGYLFTLYKKFYGFTFATVVTTLLYLSLNIVIFQKDKVYIANIILLNILLCFLFDYSKSVISTVTAHFTYILFSTFMLGSLPLSDGYPTIINYTVSEKRYLTGSEHLLESSTPVLVITVLITIILVCKKYQPVKQFKRLKEFFKTLPGNIRLWKYERRRKHLYNTRKSHR